MILGNVIKDSLVLLNMANSNTDILKDSICAICHMLHFLQESILEQISGHVIETFQQIFIETLPKYLLRNTVCSFQDKVSMSACPILVYMMLSCALDGGSSSIPNTCFSNENSSRIILAHDVKLHLFTSVRQPRAFVGF